MGADEIPDNVETQIQTLMGYFDAEFKSISYTTTEDTLAQREWDILHEINDRLDYQDFDFSPHQDYLRETFGDLDLDYDVFTQWVNEYRMGGGVIFGIVIAALVVAIIGLVCFLSRGHKPEGAP